MNTVTFLEHYGIKGMHWGVRKTSSGPQQTTNTKRKKMSDMSDTELRNVLNRLDMEKRYRTLLAEESKRNMTSFEKGKKRVLNMLGDVAETQTKRFINRRATEYMKDLEQRYLASQRGN